MNIRRFIGERIISTIVLFCYCCMIIRPSVAVMLWETDPSYEISHASEYTSFHSRPEKLNSFQASKDDPDEFIYTNSTSENLRSIHSPDHSIELLSDLPSSTPPKKQTIYSSWSSVSLFRYLLYCLCFSACLEKVWSSNNINLGS